MMIDTDRERDIGLGNRYPFDALDQGEVILHDSWQSEAGYVVGDQIKLSFESKTFWNTIVQHYNEKASKYGWE